MIIFTCDNESESGHADAYKDVVQEDAIKAGGSTLPGSRQPRTRSVTDWQTGVSESGSCQVAE